MAKSWSATIYEEEQPQDEQNDAATIHGPAAVMEASLVVPASKRSYIAAGPAAVHGAPTHRLLFAQHVAQVDGSRVTTKQGKLPRNFTFVNYASDYNPDQIKLIPPPGT